MATQSVLLLDRSATVVAVLDVAPDRDRYRGTICLDATPRELQHLFAEFEECVEGQMFTHADEVEERIAAVPLRAVFPDGGEAEVVELQVFPSAKRVSFKTRNHTGAPVAKDATPAQGTGVSEKLPVAEGHRPRLRVIRGLCGTIGGGAVAVALVAILYFGHMYVRWQVEDATEFARKSDLSNAREEHWSTQSLGARSSVPVRDGQPSHPLAGIASRTRW